MDAWAEASRIRRQRADIGEPEMLATGDAVIIRFEWRTKSGAVVARTIAGQILLSSKNGHSLTLGFDAMLGGYVDMMPVLWESESESYEDLFMHNRVEITRRSSLRA